MVIVKVDSSRRENLRRLHTATHILNFCAREVLGNHVWQNGSNLKPEVGSLDITHFDSLSIDEISKIEALANEIVFEGREVSIDEVDRGEAEKKFGFTLYQGGAIPMKKLRIVSVKDSDIEACGGLHVSNTSEIGIIKIIDALKIQDGIIRLRYVVGEFALREIERRDSILRNVSNYFSVGFDDIFKTCQKFFNDWKNLKKENEVLKKELLNNLAISISFSNEVESILPSFITMGDSFFIAEKVLDKKSSFRLVGNNFIILSPDMSFDGNFKKEINRGKFKVYII